MLEFEEYKGKLNGLKPTLVDLGKALKLEEAEAEIAALRKESEQDGFWNDVERSQKVQQRLKQSLDEVRANEPPPSCCRRSRANVSGRRSRPRSRSNACGSGMRSCSTGQRTSHRTRR